MVTNPVPNPIQRVRYFDGEYLRSYDFTNDQTYHIEMRRLMNLKLHLYGIVYGLEIVQDQDSVLPGGPFFYSIASGVAIDQMGREIVVPAPYDLGNVLTAPGLGAGKYEVWICYQETQTALPAAGYLDCNAASQNTRWQEGFQVYLNPVQGQGLMPNCGGVRLGMVILSSGGGLGLQFGNPAYNWGRHYVGIRAQSVIAPDQVDPDNYDVAATNPNDVPDHPRPGYLDVHPSVFNHGNVFVKQNMVIGDDFALTMANGAPSSIPPTGNVKITNDLFLNGSLYAYSSSAGRFYSLDQYIQNYMSQTVLGPPTTILFPSSPSASAPPISGPWPLPSPPFPAGPAGSAAQVLLSITEVVWQPPDTLSAWDTAAITVGVSLPTSGSGLSSVGGGQNTFTGNWNVGPPIQISSVWQYPITSMTVSFLVIYT
jgi:hypothetical protein